MNQETDTDKTVEPFSDSAELAPGSSDRSKVTATLPWDAPDGFRTVPGHAGKLRVAEPIGWTADNDAEAVAVWLAEKATASTHTANAYRKEAERFLFWLGDQGLTISDATREHYLLYARFLRNPEPAEKWCSGIRVNRQEPRWRPFERPLTPGTAKQSLTVLKSLISYLHTKGWLAANPMPDPRNLVSVAKQDRADQIAERQIPPRLLEELRQFVNNWTPAETNDSKGEVRHIQRRRRIIQARLAVIIELSSVLAARSSDLLNASMADIRPAPDNIGTGWVWHIPHGKGNKSGVLPIPNSIMAKISNLRIQLGLTALPSSGEIHIPLIPGLRNLKKGGHSEQLQPLSRAGLYHHIKTVLNQFAQNLEQHDPPQKSDAAIMRSASTHWFRHSAIKAITLKTGSLTTAQKLARHSSIATTADYAKATLKELGEALE